MLPGLDQSTQSTFMFLAVIITKKSFEVCSDCQIIGILRRILFISLYWRTYRKNNSCYYAYCTDASEIISSLGIYGSCNFVLSLTLNRRTVEMLS